MHFNTVWLLTSFVTLMVAIEPYQASSKPQLLITGGSSSVVDVTSVPYQVSVQIDGDQRCGGSIISPNHVLTAAQCLFWLTSSSISATQKISKRVTIRSGSSTRNERGSVHRVAEVIVHENYTGHRQKHDLVLVRVLNPFEMDTTRRSVRLFGRGESIGKGSVGIVSGFGESRQGGSGELRAVKVKILSRDECDEAFGEYGGIFDGQVCSGGGGDGPCGFDWGGPLVVDGRLAGIVALALGCNNPGFPAVYTEIGSYRDWIDKRVGYSLDKVLD